MWYILLREQHADVLEVYLPGAPLQPVFVTRVERVKQELGIK